jgi:uncharacterized protein YdeI (YjbR/CyaY-like superfamily)
MKNKNPLVDAYLTKAKIWKNEMEELRTILLNCDLTEELKWGKPCYSFENKNLFIIQAFKTNCALGFFKGELINDEKGLLVKPGENTQSGRMIRFTDLKEITKIKGTLKTYIKEAIAQEKKGTKTIIKEKADLVLTEELQTVLNKNAKFKKAFEALTPGRQRAYHIFFSAAKQSQTREARIEKYKQQILDGKGINDCTCGLSKKMPYCDGSHKFL